MRIRTGHEAGAPRRRFFGAPSPAGLKTPPAKGRFTRISPAPTLQTKHLPPVHFFAETIVNASQEASVRSEAVTNRTGRPVEIHEIRLSAIALSSLTTAFSIDPASFIGLRMSVGGKKITNAFVPMWLLGKTEQVFAQMLAGGASNSDAAASYVWRLSKPWYLPPNVEVEVDFSHTGGIRFPIRAEIGLAGKYLDSKPTTSSVPYAASYVSKPFDYTAADGSGFDFDSSSEKDLVNIAGRTINVDRIIVRVGSARVTGGVAVANFNDINHIGVARNTLLRLATSKNIPIIRDYSVVRAVFGETCAMETDFQLSPSDFLRASVKNLDGVTLTTPFTTYTSQLFASILGWREEGV